MVGSLGQPILSLAKLVLYISDYNIHILPDDDGGDVGNGSYSINDVIKSLFRSAGLEGKQVALVIEVHLIHYM